MIDFIKNISPIELGLIVFILIVLFGGKIVKNLGKTTGETFKEIKNIKKSFNDGISGKSEE